MGLFADSIDFAYDRSAKVLGGITLTAEAGSFTAIVGPNGAGKSTLARILAGLLEPTSGSVEIDGESLAQLGPTRRAQQLAYVPQHSDVSFPFSVGQVVGFGRFAAGRGRADDDLAAAALERVELADRADDPIAILSAGQQQRVAFARALLQIDPERTPIGTHGEPRYLIADEPLAAQDPRHAINLLEQLRNLAKRGFGVVVVMHDLSLALRYADSAVILGVDGTVAGCGPARAMLAPELLDDVFGVRFAHCKGRPSYVDEMTEALAALPISADLGKDELTLQAD